MQDWKLQPAHDLGLPLSQQLRSVRREGGLVNACVVIAWSAIVLVYLKLYHRLRVEGLENLPASGSFVLVANHCSHLDALVLASVIPWRMKSRVHPIAAGDTFFSSPLRGIVSTLLLNALPMWRMKVCSHALSDLRQRLLSESCVYIIFPEGTRSRSGRMSPFKSGVGMMLASTAIPVVPCGIRGTFKALPPDRRVPRPARIDLKIGVPFRLTSLSDNHDGWHKAALAIKAAVSALSGSSTSSDSDRPAG
jgi:1-acyl-sn-glycerol-3-phosphate acyltransferase